jgi:hypothetical protein
MRLLRPGLALVALASLASLAACSGSSKPPESPDAPAASAEASATPDAPAGAKGDDTAPPPSKAQQDDNSVPDDYSITAGDCDALGQQYGTAARSDQMATVSPKVSEKQRAAAEAAVDKVVSKLEQTWIDHCRSALVGKVADPRALKCAIAAPTVKAFDVCLNGDNATSDKPARGAKKK